MAVNVIEMSVRDWIEVPDCPVQRDTESRLSYAVNEHLKEYIPLHRLVIAATIKGAIVCKLDGHTRAMGWDKGELGLPPEGTVVVFLIACKNMDEAKENYYRVDSPNSVMKPRDILFGATRELGFRLRSSLLRRCEFTTQLRLAQNGRVLGNDDVRFLVKEWKPYLIQLDNLSLSDTYVLFIGVFLIAIRKYGIDTASGFITALDKGEGTKGNKGFDGIEALSRMLQVRQAQGSSAGYYNVDDLAGRAWYAFKLWLDGRKTRNGILKWVNPHSFSGMEPLEESPAVTRAKRMKASIADRDSKFDEQEEED